MINFVACTDSDCEEQSIVEQNAPWKWVSDGECKSYHRAFPGWQYVHNIARAKLYRPTTCLGRWLILLARYRWHGKPAGRSCPDCPNSFGSCTITVFEKRHCQGKELNVVPNVGASRPDYEVIPLTNSGKSWEDTRGGVQGKEVHHWLPCQRRRHVGNERQGDLHGRLAVLIEDVDDITSCTKPSTYFLRSADVIGQGCMSSKKYTS